jgi:hypothetical protein
MSASSVLPGRWPPRLLLVLEGRGGGGGARRLFALCRDNCSLRPGVLAQTPGESARQGLRGHAAELPEAQRQPWQQWTDVEETLKKADRGDTEGNKNGPSK